MIDQKISGDTVFEPPLCHRVGSVPKCRQDTAVAANKWDQHSKHTGLQCSSCLCINREAKHLSQALLFLQEQSMICVPGLEFVALVLVLA